MLDITNLACARGDRLLFRDLSFSLGPGEVLHLLGRNGSGKTTLLRTLCGLTQPETGEVRWGGTAIARLADEYRQHIAYVGHSNGIQGELTATENLRFAAGLAGNPGASNIDAALERAGLTTFRHLPAKLLSQGQKRRVALARLLLLDARLWVLDEPFTALDVQSSERMSGIVADHVAAGGMVVFTSHQELPISGKAVHRLSLDS